MEREQKSVGSERSAVTDVGLALKVPVLGPKPELLKEASVKILSQIDRSREPEPRENNREGPWIAVTQGSNPSQ